MYNLVVKLTVVIVILLAVVLGGGFWFYTTTSQPKPPKQVSLTFWGLWDEEKVIKPVIEAYQSKYPNIKITYVKQSTLNYFPRMMTQLRSGQGPDIVTVHNSWIPMMLTDLGAAPDGVVSMKDFSKAYYPVAKETLTSKDNRIFALPMEIDGLAMYYNEEILRGINATVPKNWEEFEATAKKVTVISKEGQIQTAGAALGSTSNVDFWPEIVGMLYYQQPDADIVAPDIKRGPEVIQYFAGFITDPRKKTWDRNLPSSTEMFTQGRLAFYFAPASKAQEIKEKNPNLQFKVAAVPQLPALPGQVEKKVAWGGFWALGISNRSADQEEAWKFLKFLSSPQQLQVIYQQHLQERSVGRPFPREDMSNLIASHPIFGAQVVQAPYYKSWYLNSGTGDNEINDKIIGEYKKAIDSSMQGYDTRAALMGATISIKRILDSYKPRPIPTTQK